MKTTNIDKQLKWWDSLPIKEKIYFMKKYYNKSKKTLSYQEICYIYEQEYKNKDKECTKPILTPLEYANQLQNITLEDKYDYVVTSLLTLPISLSDLYTILQILIKNKEKHK